MLESAAAQKREHTDIVVGLAHADGRDAVVHLLRAFESLPALPHSSGAAHRVTMDVAGVKARRPAILLVDCGTSALRGGAEHYDCWSDVEQIIEHGIDVWAAIDATGFSSWATIGVVAPRGANGLSLL